MALICVMSVYEEEELILRALKSLEGAGVDSVYVFDGAWKGFGVGPSFDKTRMLALDWGATVILPPPTGVAQPAYKAWESQEAKRSYMFHHCGAEEGDHVFVFDADEELEGAFPKLPQSHHTMMVKCVGRNDMPGIRGEWPHGDYAPFYKPELRVFLYHPTLECRWPGGYWCKGERIVVYDGNASALPVVEGATFLHHGNDRSPERIQQKRDFYEVEHPLRRARQDG